VIFIDSNIPMYVIGAPHPLKDVAGPMLERVLREQERLVTNAEVLQEILHRYTSIRRREAIPVAFELVLDIVDTVFPIELQDMEEARRILLDSEDLSARDSLHYAIMRRYEIGRIMSFDGDFDGLPGIERISS